MDVDTLIRSLADLPAATLHEVMNRQNALGLTIRPLWRPLHICGPAFTVQSRAGDNLATHWALAVAPAGSVLVISQQDNAEYGGWGEITSTAARARGLLGLVTDGAVRDIQSCQLLGFPIFCQGVSIKGTTKDYPGALNVQVTLAGVTIRPGDYIVADDDGVVVVPKEVAEDVVRKSIEKELKEAEIISRLQNDELTVDLFGLRSKLPGLSSM